jgi:sortase A
MTAAQKQWLGRLVLTLPPLVSLTGLVLMGFFGWKYLWETIWVNDRPLPEYRPVAGQPLWFVTPAEGQKIGELVFPAQHVEVPVVQGITGADLELGAGHYIASALPGQGSNIYVAGHRDTVFRVLRQLKAGDRIDFVTPYGDFVYQAVNFEIVSPSATNELAPTPFETLTLQTCWPFSFFGFAPLRYIVHTKLVSEPTHPNV